MLIILVIFINIYWYFVLSSMQKKWQIVVRSLGCFFWDDLTSFVSHGKQCGLARSLFKIKRSVAFIISCYKVQVFKRKHRNMKNGDRNRKTFFIKDFNQTRFRQTEDVAWNLIFLSSEKICSSEFEMPSELQRFKTKLKFAKLCFE
jgi:hypothetical protein